MALLALALAVAAYVAMRQEADLKEQAHSACVAIEDLEKAGLAEAIAQASDAIVIADRDGTIEYVNPAYIRMTGYRSEEIVGRNPYREKAGFGPAVHEQMAKAFRAGQIWRGEAANRRKDGATYIEEITLAPVRDAQGTIRKCIAVRRDTSPRKAAEETQSFLASIVESSEDAIMSSTPDGMIRSWNRGAERLYGYSAAEILGKPVSVLAPREERARLKQIGEQLERGESAVQFEGTSLTKDGRRIQVSFSAWPMRNAAGEIIARACISRDTSARAQAQEARALLASILDSAQDAIVGASADAGIISWNKGAETIYGYSAAEVLGKPLSMLSPPDRAGETRLALERVARGETISQWETKAVRRDGQMMDVSLTLSPVRNACGDVVGSSTVARDITPSRRDREALEQSEQRYRTLVANLPDVVVVADESGDLVFAGPNCERLTGYTQDEMCAPGLWLQRIHPDDRPHVEDAYRELFDTGQSLDTEYRFLRKDGRWVWLQSRSVSTHERDGRRYRDGLLSDITERKRLEQTLAHQATHDLLTGLPNRALFEDRFYQALSRARRHGRMAALMYLDLDRFKRINDTLGQAAGDHLIQASGARLAASMRESETVSRGSGDRFLLVLGEVRDPQGAIKAAERIQAVMARPFTVKGHEVFLTASIGIALFPRHGEDLPSMQRAAESALAAAKRQGKQRIQLSTPEFSQTTTRGLAIETELHYALERREISLDYQPQFNLAGGRIEGLEALVRWNNPKFGLVPPSVLIPIAEETGLIVPIGAYVLREGCGQGKLWHAAGYAPLHVAVNASAVQFARGDLPETVSATLEETGLPPDSLQIEVTESVLMQDIRETARQLRELKKLGVSVSLDDFGTGYSSLSYLEELPIDTLKIDRKFVQRMNGSENNRTLVQSVVGLAHGLGMRVVAEGVETPVQLQQLQAMGCDLAQSFMLGCPARARSIEELLAGTAARERCA